jgi:hypothetical protein
VSAYIALLRWGRDTVTNQEIACGEIA